MTVRRRLYYCDHYPIPLPPGHKFPIRKYAMLRALLAAADAYDLIPAPFAAPADLELAHDAAYVQSILRGTVDERVMRRIGFPWSPELVRRTLASVGGTLAAARDAMQFGFGGNLAGGTHHAFRHEGSGFCVFNDLAVAILALRRDGLAFRAAALDLDVHQGDGTAAIFKDDDAVLTISIHGEHNFPFRKQCSRIDLALPDGAADTQYLDCLEQVLPEMISYKPDVIFYQAGVDALACDRLGRLALTPEGLRRRDQMVREAAATVPLVVTLGGGYADPIEETANAHATTFLTFLNRP